MRRKIITRIALVLALVVCAAASVLVFRSYKIKQVEKEALRFVDWLQDDVLKWNAVTVKQVYGRKEPDWLGVTNIHVLLQAPSGQELTINAFIDSSLTETKFVRLYLFHSEVTDSESEKYTAEQWVGVLQHPRGAEVELPVDTIGSGRPVDLRKLLPSAFENVKK